MFWVHEKRASVFQKLVSVGCSVLQRHAILFNLVEANITEILRSLKDRNRNPAFWDTSELCCQVNCATRHSRTRTLDCAQSHFSEFHGDSFSMQFQGGDVVHCPAAECLTAT